MPDMFSDRGIMPRQRVFRKGIEARWSSYTAAYPGMLLMDVRPVPEDARRLSPL